MTGRGLGLPDSKKRFHGNNGKSKNHAQVNCPTTVYFVSDCTKNGLAACRICGKPKSILSIVSM